MLRTVEFENWQEFTLPGLTRRLMVLPTSAASTVTLITVLLWSRAAGGESVHELYLPQFTHLQ